MDLAMVLSDKRDDPPDMPSDPIEHDNKRQRLDDAGPAPKDSADVIAAASSATRRDPQTPYTDLQKAVHNALENKEAALTMSDKVALALEVLRARQLELDLAQARNNIEALITKTGSAPRSLRAVIPASTVKGLPVGTPVEIGRGKFLLSPTTDDPQALFLTLELQSFGPEREHDTPNKQDAAEEQKNTNP